jgi:hypothetical protein
MEPEDRDSLESQDRVISLKRQKLSLENIETASDERDRRFPSVISDVDSDVGLEVSRIKGS